MAPATAGETGEESRDRRAIGRQQVRAKGDDPGPGGGYRVDQEPEQSVGIIVLHDREQAEHHAEKAIDSTHGFAPRLDA